MKFTDINIQTFRSAPGDARGVGVEYLYRAGYLDRDYELTELGILAVDRFFQVYGKELPKGTVDSLGGTIFADNAGGGTAYLLSENGKTAILTCSSCAFGEIPERIQVDQINTSTEQPLEIEKVLTPNCGTIKDLAAFLGIQEAKTAKALLFTRLADNKVIFAVTRGDRQLSMEKLENHFGKTRMATADEIASIGAVPGYASPIGTRDAFIIVDQMIERSSNLAAGANEAGYHLVNTNYGRDYTAHEVLDLVSAQAGDPCPRCKADLKSATAYPYQAGDSQILLTAIAENLHDDHGLTLTPSCAPADIYLMNIPGKEIDTSEPLVEIQKALEAQGFRVLVDDRPERAGIKFNDADLIGLPIRIAVGERALKENSVEVRPRHAPEAILIPIDDLPQYLRKHFLKGI